MKKDIHPQYYPKAKAVCACGNSFVTGATQENIHVEICSACHPFYTGKEKTFDRVGQVQKFKERMDKGKGIAQKSKQSKTASKTAVKKDTKTKPAAKKPARPGPARPGSAKTGQPAKKSAKKSAKK